MGYIICVSLHECNANYYVTHSHCTFVVSGEGGRQIDGPLEHSSAVCSLLFECSFGICKLLSSWIASECTRCM